MLRDVLCGALRVWEVEGTVEADEHGLIVAAGGATLRVVPRAPHGWLVLSGAAVQDLTPIGEHAGVPGLLRQLREELAPHAPRGRLIVGAPNV